MITHNYIYQPESFLSSTAETHGLCSLVLIYYEIVCDNYLF